MSSPIQITLPRPTSYQIDAFFCEHRYGLAEANTKAGKTVGAIIWQAHQVLSDKLGQEHWWVAPIYRQTDIAYRRVKKMLPQQIYKANNGNHTLTFGNGARWVFLSGEKPDNLFGEDVASAVIDEGSRVREESWHAIRTTVTATKGPIRIIGNVKGRLNWFYKLCREGEKGAPNVHFTHIAWEDAVEAGILDLDEIEDARRRLPPSVFRELYEAIAADDEGRVYKDFGPDNIAPDITDVGGTIHIGMDFNVDPMTACIGSRVADQLHIWDEIYLSNSNTEEMCAEINSRYPDRDIVIYPDPSGRARKTSAPIGQTDLTILKGYGYDVVSPKAAPAVVDRINEVNAVIKNAEGYRRLHINSDLDYIIECLEMLVYKEGTSQPDKSMNIEHMTDALGYLIHAQFPIGKKGSMVVKRAKGF